MSSERVVFTFARTHKLRFALLEGGTREKTLLDRLPLVILSAAKDLIVPKHTSCGRYQILRCAQDDKGAVGRGKVVMGCVQRWAEALTLPSPRGRGEERLLRRRGTPPRNDAVGGIAW